MQAGKFTNAAAFTDVQAGLLPQRISGLVGEANSGMGKDMGACTNLRWPLHRCGMIHNHPIAQNNLRPNVSVGADLTSAPSCAVSSIRWDEWTQAKR